uniref:Uncharacterized protein n=1 Tax=Crocodylus porosus TaxID=8502 RepID=A0A7M4F2C1_CROPO
VQHSLTAFPGVQAPRSRQSMSSCSRFSPWAIMAASSLWFELGSLSGRSTWKLLPLPGQSAAPTLLHCLPTQSAALTLLHDQARAVLWN